MLNYFEFNSTGTEGDSAFKYEKLKDGDSVLMDQIANQQNENKLTITKKKSIYFYMSTLTVSVLYSMYYCLFLSKDDEIELISSKILQSVIILIITITEVIINFGIEKQREKEALKYISLIENKAQRDSLMIGAESFEMEKKELYFYDVVYGMMSFTSELLIYYFLSLSSNFSINIGTMYSLITVQYLILLLRFPYFNVKFGMFQLIGAGFSILGLVLLCLFYIPNYNPFIVIGAALTISIFKFIQYCIFEYIHEKTRDAKKLLRQSNYVDGLIGLMLMIFIFISKKREWIIQDLSNLLRVALGTLFYYFAMKISTQKESDYKLHNIFSSLNFIFVSIFDYLINNRKSSFTELSLVSVLSLTSILMFVNSKIIIK